MVLVLHASFDVAAITAFFTNADQLNLDPRTVAQLAVGGIASPADLPDFDKEDTKSI